MTHQEILIGLNMVVDLGNIKLKRLVETFGSPEEILKSSKGELKRVEGISDGICDAITKIKENRELEKELGLIKKHKVDIITIVDSGYPQNLKEIYDPPTVLYVKGGFKKQDSQAVGIVGSRRASFYGLSVAEKLAGDLAGLGITIASGMARGIDSSAHRGALKAGGRTIAVLGSGLLRIYPPENKPLFNQIQDNGAVISEFPLETEPFAKNFPRRNRIISGLSLGVVVVEAARNSGAMITADCALEQGRDVFAVPGKVDSNTSWGTNKLIKQGAKLVEDAQDILEELKGELKLKLKEAKQEKSTKEKETPGSAPSLSTEESAIFDLLSSKPSYIDEIIDGAGIEAGKVMSVLIKLEIRHLIKQLPGKMFVKV
ncbi:MAG: DNA-processing protein DprA [Candidatus Omnitrophota bacterium]